MPQILEHIWQMKAPQIVLWGLFLFYRHPPSGRHRGGVLRGYGYRQPEREGYRVTVCIVWWPFSIGLVLGRGLAKNLALARLTKKSRKK